MTPSAPSPAAPPLAVAKGLSPGRAAWRRFRRNPAAMTGCLIIALLVVYAIVGPSLSPHAYDEQNYDHLREGPSALFWFGTDDLGRDLFVLCAMGARVSLAVGLFASLISLLVGVGYGAVSGWFGGRTDQVMMRIVDILYGIPLLLIVINLMVILGSGLQNVFIALGMVYWLNMARIVRGQVLRLRASDYVEAARALGAGRLRLIVRHILPNTLGPIIVTLTLTIPQAIFTESFLSCIGLGGSAPNESWGTLASSGARLELVQYSPHLVLFPAAAISLAMLAFNFVGDGLRDALDPRDLRKKGP
ncbi:MAG: ABC transporter permease [Candidatus Sumerlaeia bacterium]|nr:ABC transporter permease [Candidatus Sumerlaeia bacterium]